MKLKVKEKEECYNSQMQDMKQYRKADRTENGFIR